jgi:hypothetical protein
MVQVVTMNMRARARSRWGKVLKWPPTAEVVKGIAPQNIQAELSLAVLSKRKSAPSRSLAGSGYRPSLPCNPTPSFSAELLPRHDRLSCSP